MQFPLATLYVHVRIPIGMTADPGLTHLLRDFAGLIENRKRKPPYLLCTFVVPESTATFDSCLACRLSSIVRRFEFPWARAAAAGAPSPPAAAYAVSHGWSAAAIG